MWTRQQYLNNECTHDQYYGQFVPENLNFFSTWSVGRAYTYPDTPPIHEWDRFVGMLLPSDLPNAVHLASSRGFKIQNPTWEKINGQPGVTLSDLVCMYKRAFKSYKLTLEIQKIDAKKRYKTKEGYPIIMMEYKTGNWSYPISGTVVKKSKNGRSKAVYTTWDEVGSVFGDGRESKNDIDLNSAE